MRFVFLATLFLPLPLCAQVKITQAAPDRLLVEIDGKPYTTFHLAPGGNKPYVWPLSTATGLVVTRHFPMEEFAGEIKDHPHHRGMFFSHGDINGINYWGTEPLTEAEKARAKSQPKGQPRLQRGSMRLKRVLQMKGGRNSGTIKAAFEGLDASGKPVMAETRTIVFHKDPVLRTIDYEIVIQPLEKLTFRDTKEGTFGFRLATSMQENQGSGRMTNAEGAQTEKNVWGKRSAWVDYCGPVDGQTVGVAIFDHPSNPRHPTYWHSRAYGLHAANIFGVRDFTGDKTKDGSLTIDRGQSLRFRYRVVIHPGDTAAAGIAGLYKGYASRK
ncbi:MAG: PmoA family protein [Bryobacteraceae bacterium]